jgi:hypothetical protein
MIFYFALHPAPSSVFFSDASFLGAFLPFQALPRRDDLMPLADLNFICKAFSDIPREASQEAGASSLALANAVLGMSCRSLRCNRDC